MNTDRDLQRHVAQVFADAAPVGDPDELLARVLSTTSRARPRPTWLANLKEPPMRFPARVAVGSPTFRLATILAVTLALILAAAGAVAGAASLLPKEPTLDPFGPARNGSLIYEDAGDIYLADADGGNPRAIITGSTNDWSPWFSRDGRTIAFARGDKTDFAMMLADVDGSNVRQLLGAGEWNLEFMPGDQEMVGTLVIDGHAVLSTIDVATGLITDLNVGGLEPTFFQTPRPPEGDEIIFTAHPTPGGPEEGLYAIRPDGSGLRAVGVSYANEPIEDPPSRRLPHSSTPSWPPTERPSPTGTGSPRGPRTGVAGAGRVSTFATCRRVTSCRSGSIPPKVASSSSSHPTARRWSSRAPPTGEPRSTWCTRRSTDRDRVCRSGRATPTPTDRASTSRRTAPRPS